MTIKELKDYVAKQKHKWIDCKYILQDLRENETLFDWFEFELIQLTKMIESLQ
jgi:hypothetical protein